MLRVVTAGIEQGRLMRERIARPAENGPSRSGTTRSVSDRSSQPAVPRGVRVSSPLDPVEQEADRVAQNVVSDARPRSHSSGTPAGGPGAPLPRPPHHGTLPSLNLLDVSRRTGRPLDPASRAFFEPRFGFDFSAIRIHADAEASASARSLGARAYTAGAHIVFHDGEYAPLTATGRRLLAHELTHVVQQSDTASPVVHMK